MSKEGTISLELAKKWSRACWTQGQSKKRWIKRPRNSIYDLNHEPMNQYLPGYDCFDYSELERIAKEVRFIISTDEFTVETLGTNILVFCKYLKINISDIKI